jgi:lipopolysaccharide transport system permease protein
MITIIENKKGLNLKQRIKELYDYRELLWTLAYRDFRVKYTQTFLGIFWAIIEPLFTAILLSFVFNKVAKAGTLGINPILFGLTGMIAWNYFANVVGQGTASLITAQNMIKKIYFPKVILPASKALAALPDLLITLVFTLVFYFILWHQISIYLVFFPIFLILTVLSAMSLGIWFSAMNIRYRDFRHIVPFVIRIGLFVTPIAYTTTEVPDQYRWIFFLNPMTGIIEGIRWSLFGLQMNWDYFYISIGMIIFLFISGFIFFNKMEKNIADII